MRCRARIIAVILAALVPAACGDATDQPGDTGAPPPSVSSSTPSSTGSPPSSAPPTTVVPTTVVPATVVPSTTAAPGPVRVVDTRNPIPADAQRLVTAGETFGSAIALPDGSILVAVRASQFDLCSARIDRVDPATGARSPFAAGAEPQVSPDGRTVAYAARSERVREGDGGCSVVDIGLYDLATQTDHVVRLEPATGGAVAIDLRWSPDSRRLAAKFGFDYSELTGSGVLDAPTRAMTVLRVGPELTATLNRTVGARADAPWTPWPARWLSDNTLVVSATCCYGEPYDESSIPRWWTMPANGTLGSLDDALTDPVLVAQLPPPFE